MVEQYVNFDLEHIVTPVNPGVFGTLLRETNYDPTESEFLIRGFTEGFELGYEGPLERHDSANNIPLQVGVGSRTELWNKIMKEV